jgi:hypothetical protein
MRGRIQTDDAFAEIPFGKIISCRQGHGCAKGELWSKIIKMVKASILLVYKGITKTLILNGL